MRGRKPKPAELKALQGNPGKRAQPAPPAEPDPEPPAQPPETASTAPKHLSDAAARVWATLAPHLTRLKFLRVTDQEAFARYCEHIARYWHLTRALATTGETYETETKHGRMRRINPEFLVRDRIERQLESLEDRFGMSPRARQQILQQMAAATPALPFGDPPGREAEHAPEPPSPSPVGVLNSGTTSVH